MSMIGIDLPYTGTLVIMRCPVADCGVVYGLDEQYQQRRTTDGKSWRCPNGHSLSYHETDFDREKKARGAAEKREQWAREDAARQRKLRETAERGRAAASGHYHRIKRRVAAGVCPCCNRSFVALARHIATKHPEWKSAE